MAPLEVSAEVREAEKKISRRIKDAEVELKKQYPILNYQDALGTLIFFGSLAGIILSWRYYFENNRSVWSTAVLMFVIAICTSLLHELEHDIIHNLYWKRIPIFQDIMFLFIWLSKLHSNPWFRREMHLKHHIVSGQLDDAEERLIGLGLPFGFKRLAVSTHPFGALIVSSEVAKDAKWLNVQRMNLTSMPVAFLFFGLSKLFTIYMVAFYLLPPTYAQYLPMKYWDFIRDTNILICLPNMIRQTALVLMSNCSHYYGDIPEKSVFYQNQILDHWTTFPFQLLCFNFGKRICRYLHVMLKSTLINLGIFMPMMI
jgi:fatty acid desaturase